MCVCRMLTHFMLSKVTIRPSFSGTVPIFNDVSRKSSHGMPVCPVCGLVPQFAHLCSRMLTHRWPKISSDFICIYEKIASRRGSAPDHNPKSDPDCSRLWRLHPTISAIGARPRLQCPNYGHLNVMLIKSWLLWCRTQCTKALLQH